MSKVYQIGYKYFTKELIQVPTGGSDYDYIPYQDGIWGAPEYLGSYTDRKAFRFEIPFSVTNIVDSNGTITKYREFQNLEIQEDKIPQNPEIIKSNNLIIIQCNNPLAVDTYASVKDYVSRGFIITPDMYCDISTHIPLTLEVFKQQVMHYTGKSWCYKGLNGYTRDGGKFYFNFGISVNIKEYTKKGNEIDEDSVNYITDTRNFKILCNPDYSFTEFKNRYKEYCESAETEFKNALQ